MALLAAVVGQGVGAILGGCSWIGVSLPVHRQVWALVNEPTVAFASGSGAWGYWLGSVVFPALVAGLTLALVPRSRTVAAELGAVQTAWAAAAAGLGILPMLGGRDAHLAQWLELHDLPGVLVWFGPLAAIPLTLPAVLRLLALDREGVRNPSRLRRFLVVVLHLALPAVGWFALVSSVRGALCEPAAAGLAAVLLGGIVTAVLAYPARLGARYAGPTRWSAVRLGLFAVVVWAVVAVAGRPLPGGRVAAVLWSRPLATNNVRSWMVPVRPPWRVPGDGGDQRPASSSR